MVVTGTLVTLACAWLLVCAAPRHQGPLSGWPGTALGLAGMALAAWLVRAGGWGLAASMAFVLGVLMLAIPWFSYRQARRRSAAKGAGHGS